MAGDKYELLGGYTKYAAVRIDLVPRIYDDAVGCLRDPTQQKASLPPGNATLWQRG